MPSITPQDALIVEVTGGVDTHQDTHTAAVIDQVGRVLGTQQFPADEAGYAALLAWMCSVGRLTRVGVEGTGAYGAGLVRLLRDEGVQVVEVDRKTRRFQGKSDPIDAIQAAKAALAGDRTGTPKQRDGRIEALRNLRVARRHQQLSAEITDLDKLLDPLVAAICPALVAANGVGTDVAGQLLVTAGQNHDRLRSEAAFAMLCGVAPIPASSGKTNRHRLNRGGDRQANAALYRVVLCRLRWDPRTRDYMERRTKEGLSKKEIIRCLKRYIARELYRIITSNDHELAA